MTTPLEPPEHGSAEGSLLPSSLSVVAPRSSVLGRVQSLTDAVGSAVAKVTAVLLVGVVIVICTSVFYRYGLHSPLVWAEEAALRAYVWMTFLGFAVLVHSHGLIAVDFLPLRMRESRRQMLEFGTTCLSLPVYALLVVQGAALLEIVAIQHSPALGLPAWTLYASAPTSGILCLFFALSQLGCWLMRRAIGVT